MGCNCNVLTCSQVVPSSSLDRDTYCCVLVFHIFLTQISEQQLSYVTISVLHIFSKFYSFSSSYFNLITTVSYPQREFVLCNQRPVLSIIHLNCTNYTKIWAVIYTTHMIPYTTYCDFYTYDARTSPQYAV
jgi:hypothetical protein